MFLEDTGWAQVVWMDCTLKQLVNIPKPCADWNAMLLNSSSDGMSSFILISIPLFMWCERQLNCFYSYLSSCCDKPTLGCSCICFGFQICVLSMGDIVPLSSKFFNVLEMERSAEVSQHREWPFFYCSRAHLCHCHVRVNFGWRLLHFKTSLLYVKLCKCCL